MSQRWSHPAPRPRHASSVSAQVWWLVSADRGWWWRSEQWWWWCIWWSEQRWGMSVLADHTAGVIIVAGELVTQVWLSPLHVLLQVWLSAVSVVVVDLRLSETVSQRRRTVTTVTMRHLVLTMNHWLSLMMMMIWFRLILEIGGHRLFGGRSSQRLEITAMKAGKDNDTWLIPLDWVTESHDDDTDDCISADVQTLHQQCFSEIEFI